MNVAWIVNEIPRSEYTLPGEHLGGGEMADAGMIAHAPVDVTVTRIAASQWEQALGFDRVIVAATDQLTDQAMLALAAREPIVWVHHQQAPSVARQRLFQAAAPLVCMSAMHARIEAGWSETTPVWNHGWVSPDDVAPADKTHDALWAARNHPQKGRIGARIWAASNGRRLTEMTNAPRQDVLDAMAIHRTFVFLPKLVDACPRTLIEAELAGCEIVTNARAGRRDPGDIREVLLAQPGRFWGLL